MCSSTGDLVLWSVLLKIFTGNIPSDWNENIFKEVDNFSVIEREKEGALTEAAHFGEIENCFL